MLVIEDSESVDLQEAWKQLAENCRERLEEAGFHKATVGDLDDTQIALSARQYINLKCPSSGISGQLAA